MRVTFHIDMRPLRNLRIGTGSAEVQAQRRKIIHLAEALCQCNLIYLRFHPGTPGLYQSRVVYKEEGYKESEDWKDIPHVLADGFGDCEDLATWRVAELRHRGVRARIAVKMRRLADITLFHVLVRYPDGRLEDPSKRLGMKTAY